MFIVITMIFAGLSSYGAPTSQDTNQLLDSLYESGAVVEPEAGEEEANFLDQFNPNSPDAEALLDAMEANDDFAFIEDLAAGNLPVVKASLGGQSIKIIVDKSEQTLYFYMNGKHMDSWLVSTARSPFSTPTGTWNPVPGRIYTKYSSTKYPGGSWKGLGNMPYAIFFYRGFALHGTTAGNIPKLGRPASHGCVRMHPNNAKYLNGVVKDAVRTYGYSSVVIQVRK
ncbi:MAG: L,D-transpeptidase [Bdellovibrionales bacterium]|nr:L,D-transpeptidase [Bdellovibrionales bacterium]